MRHRFVFDVSRFFLLLPVPETITVLEAEVDNAGVDLVLVRKNVARHIQMKTLSKNSTGNPYAVAEALDQIDGGCVIWMCYDRKSLKPTAYHFMGNRGPARMESLKAFDKCYKKKGGVRVERKGYRTVKIRDAKYQKLALNQLVSILFDLEQST